MARTVIPPQAISTKVTAEKLRSEEAQEKGDNYSDKLVKYVPAETLAFFVPAAAYVGQDRQALLIAVVVIAVLGTAGYLFKRSRSLPLKQRPTWIYYVLAVIAFLCWAIGTTPSVARLAGIDQVVAGLVLLGAVFLIPLADDVTSKSPEPDVQPANPTH